MADFVNSQCYDYFESGESSDWYPNPKKTIKCNKCKSFDVYWSRHNSGKWFLKNKKTHDWHNCEKKEIENPLSEIDLLKHEIKRLNKIIDDLNWSLNNRYRNYKSSYDKPYNVKEEQRKANEQYKNAKICPYCGDRAGFSMGTGDCGCQVDPE